MRVALELQPCCGNRSGIGTYTYELARRLRNEDGLSYQGNLFNFRGRNDNRASLSGISFPISENRSMPYGVYRRIWGRLPLSYNSLFPPADICHFFNYIVPPRITGKVITTIHDMTYLRFPETMDKKILQRITKGIAHSVEVSQKIITVSQFSKREIMELLGLPAERIAVVYNAPSLSGETAEPGVLAREYKIRAPYLLYVGTIEPRKNLERLLKAFGRLKQDTGLPHQLVLAGGRGWQCEGIYQTASRIPGKEDVIFCGYVSGAVKNTLYQNAQAFVFPSVYEGFGIPPLEAMSFGVPVVCADAASLPEVVGDSARLVKAEDELSIAEGIHQVLTDQAYADLLRRKGPDRARQFSWERSAQVLRDIYRSMG